jgi:hypothetical protein
LGNSWQDIVLFKTLLFLVRLTYLLFIKSWQGDYLQFVENSLDRFEHLQKIQNCLSTAKDRYTYGMEK